MGEQKPSRWTKCLLRLSATFAILLGGCYLIQPDWLAAVVLVPPWLWLFPAGLVLLVSLRHWRTVTFRVTAVVWIAFLLLFVEQSRTLFRHSAWPTQEWTRLCRQHQCLRVVSLNCGDGGVKSLREVSEWNPDLVLIQESPGEDAIRQVAREMFGEDAFVLYSWNSSIIGRGELQEQVHDEDDHFVHARVKLSDGDELDVVSLRLSPPVARLDFWAPGFWRDHLDRRQDHRHEIETVLTHLQDRAKPSHVIIGGDFNAPPYDGALWPLNDELRDTFAQAGRGWGGTGSNGYPLFRVDQIRVNDEFQIGAAFSVKTVHSDHRMVVCDLLLEKVP